MLGTRFEKVHRKELDDLESEMPTDFTALTSHVLLVLVLVLVRTESAAAFDPNSPGKQPTALRTHLERLEHLGHLLERAWRHLTART